MSINTNFTDDLKRFINNNTGLCIFTLGLAAIVFSLGNLCGRCVAWLTPVSGQAKTIDSLYQQTLNGENDQIPPPSDKKC